MTDKRLYLAVAACAVSAYLGSLANGFALDDVPIIVRNAVVHDSTGPWRAFTEPYWAAAFGGDLYRPLPIASFWLDARLDGARWFHFVNVLWHVAASVGIAALGLRCAGSAAGLLAGLLFAVHPVHVEAVANVVGRADLMAAVFACLAVYAALVRGSVAWSAAAFACGLLSKESAAVVPAIVAWAWVLGIARPPRRRGAAFLVAWLLVGLAYGLARWAVLQPYARLDTVAPVFVGEGPLAVRLTGIAALADVGRLLVFPLHLRADYSPAERTIVRSVLDGRFALGLACLAVWGALLILAWRRRRTVEALGLGWLAIAYLPVANLLFPVGILLAERTLYLPSAGLALAAGAWVARLPVGRWRVAAPVLLIAAGVRTALRVPVWRSDASLTLSVLEDSPRSYVGLSRAADHVERSGQRERALQYLRMGMAQHDRDPRLFYAAADLAFTLGRGALADSMLARAEALCGRCGGYYERRAARASARGDTATARWLLEKRWASGGP